MTVFRDIRPEVACQLELWTKTDADLLQFTEDEFDKFLNSQATKAHELNAQIPMVTTQAHDEGGDREQAGPHDGHKGS